MDQFVLQIDANLPLLTDAMNKGMKAATQTTLLTAAFERTEERKHESRQLLAATGTLRDAIEGALTQLHNFRLTAQGMPPMTVDLNRSKRAVINVIDRLMEEFKSSGRLLAEVEVAIRGLDETDTSMDRE